MKYITPEIFQSTAFDEWTMAGVKRSLDALEAGTATCQDSWKSRWSMGGVSSCCGKIEIYVIRHYGRRWDYVNLVSVKTKYITLDLFCEAHKPKRCRKATQKELFYIKIC